ncbi:MAG: hypothetical protein KAQ74_01940, partial [Dehalococcoidia bacterium]|nr:hypothetical protein [Dehalococcoidia bacterium]
MTIIEPTQVEMLLRDTTEATALFGQYNKNLKEIESAFDAQIIARGESIRIEGNPEEVELVRSLFEKLMDLVQGKHYPSANDVKYLIAQIKAGVGVDGV